MLWTDCFEHGPSPSTSAHVMTAQAFFLALAAASSKCAGGQLAGGCEFARPGMAEARLSCLGQYGPRTAISSRREVACALVPACEALIVARPYVELGAVM